MQDHETLNGHQLSRQMNFPWDWITFRWMAELNRFLVVLHTLAKTAVSQVVDQLGVNLPAEWLGEDEPNFYVFSEFHLVHVICL